MRVVDSASFRPGGYYLTSVYGAMSLIRNFQEEQAAKALSSETKNTLRQWHQRRTTIQRSAPSFDDFQVRRRRRRPESVAQRLKIIRD